MILNDGTASSRLVDSDELAKVVNSFIEMMGPTYTILEKSGSVMAAKDDGTFVLGLEWIDAE